MSVEFTISESFRPLLTDEHRYLVMVGGKGSGKSKFCPRKILYRCLQEGGLTFLLLRKVFARVRDSVQYEMLEVLEQNKIPFDHNKSDHTIKFRNARRQMNTLLLAGLDDPQKIFSIAGINGGAWLEETVEFTKDDFTKLDLSIRERGAKYLQLMLTFNPDEALAPWLKDVFFGHLNPDARVHYSTVTDNPIKEFREAYRKQLDAIDDEELKKIYRHGQWGALRGLIYSWDVVPLPTDIVFDETFYGGDFGYSVDPAALVKVYRKADEYWLEEKLYQTGLTNDELATVAKGLGLTDADITVWDSAEEKSIEELRRRGLNVLGADKGAGSVKVGIDFLKSRKIHIVEGSNNLIKEVRTYKWKQDGNGNSLPVPVKYNDHGLDAVRYSIVKMADSHGIGIAYIGADGNVCYA